MMTMHDVDAAAPTRWVRGAVLPWSDLNHFSNRLRLGVAFMLTKLGMMGMIGAVIAWRTCPSLCDELLGNSVGAGEELSARCNSRFGAHPLRLDALYHQD